jgi:hypothetical protein
VLGGCRSPLEVSTVLGFRVTSARVRTAARYHSLVTRAMGKGRAGLKEMLTLSVWKCSSSMERTS